MSYKYYNLIYEYFKDKKTSKGVLYMNHIDEGIKILEELKADKLTIEAYILHPFIQCVNLKGADSKIIMTQEEMEKYLNIYEIEPEIVAKLFLYRKFANAYLCRPETDNMVFKQVKFLLIRLCNYQDIIKMLIADKIQNYKDFLKHRKNDHPRSEELNYYFNMWLKVLYEFSVNDVDKNYILNLKDKLLKDKHE